MIESSATGSAMTSSEAVVLQKVRIAAIELVNTCRFINLDSVDSPFLRIGLHNVQPFPKPDVGPSSHYNLPNLLGPMGLFPSHQQQKKIFYIIPRAFLSYEKRIDINGQYSGWIGSRKGKAHKPPTFVKVPVWGT